MASSLLSILLLLMVGVLVARISAGRLARWAVPAIVLELLVGFVLGNTVLPFSRIQPLSGLMELGVLSLFFMVGLEVSEGLNSSRGLAVLRTVLLSALTPLLAWWPLQLGFGFPPGTTLLCIAVLSATGTGVTLRTLAQAGSLNSPSGRLLVGVSVLDDLPAIALLSLSMILGIGPQPALQAASPLPAALVLPPAIGLPVGLALAGGSLLACRLWRRKVGPWQAGPLEVLLLLIGCSWLGEVVGFTSLLGALWAGVLLSRLAPMVSTDPATTELRGNLALIWEVFLPLYFIGVGMRIDASTLLQPQAWWLALLLIALGVACKLLCGLGINRRDQAAGIDRWVVVFGLIPRGLPGLVFASTALEAGIISKQLFSSLVLMVSATTVLGLLLLARRLQTIKAMESTSQASEPCQLQATPQN